ncbi:MAG: isoleucine--tRNA ligase [candidate division WOR-3 bacterium]|nr:isoleucine--tRNA ligase [candidate division WOR-3 bacterium]MCX7756964.1 isoleucine--tRNA ligase [candidate division WOR-3 bacterium]MDW7987546.1 isoleucine--tRNA ligase [candidate division WOR-3 bacterium]
MKESYLDTTKLTPIPQIPDFVSIEHKILEFWKTHDCFNKLRAKNRGKKKFSFLDGPITANNPMGVHHAWGRTYKDMFQRYKAMLGYDQRYQNGFDCQGLWVEVEVEKELGFKSKRDIEQFGIDNFVNKCKERVLKYSKIQTEQSIRLGQWMDWENSYYTMSDENNYTIWYFLKRCHEHGWIYKGDDVMPWCPRCGTALSEHEIVTEGYKELTHPSVYLRFPIKGKHREYLLVWTTTPWTLSSNVACAVHPDLIYLKVKEGDDIYYLVSSRTSVFKNKIEVLGEFLGKELVGLEYIGPYDELPAQKGVAHKVISWDEVSGEEGTGIVHIAPGCGKEDYELGKIYNLAVIAPLTEDGYFLDNFGFLSGLQVKESAEIIFKDLEKKGMLYKIEDYTHRYPVCWRCNTELVFRLVDEWFISMKELRYKIMEVAKQVRWIPDYGLERELDWLRNMQDWCISKKRYWGLALPIYECSCGHFDVIGGKEELKARAVEGWERFEGHSPHRPWIDEVKIACKKCANKVARIPDVGNPWLDAGIVPYSTMGYLTNRAYWQEWFPADFVTECLAGQFRNWFYAILAMSTVLENTTPVRVILGHGKVLDEQGEEMHKSKGNVIWFDQAAETMGADIMRYIFVNHNPEDNLNFGYRVADEVKRKILTFWNVYNFFVTYARIDRPKIKNTPWALKELPLTDLDRWILSRLQGLISEVRKALDDYNPAPVMKHIERFVDDLSSWYVRRNRRRFWKSAEDLDKLAAYQTLYECLVSQVKILAPIMPFFAEEIYQNLVRSCDPSAPESVHLNDYPEVKLEFRDLKLEEEMDTVRELVSLGLSARKAGQIKVRQPLRLGLILGLREDEEYLLEKYRVILLEELNLKEIKRAPSQDAILAHYISNQSTESSRFQFYIDPTLDKELINEGLAREFVHKVQNLRKEAGFEVADRIELYFDGTDNINEAVQRYEGYIKNEVLAVKLESLNTAKEYEIKKELTINKEKAIVALMRIKTN